MKTRKTAPKGAVDSDVRDLSLAAAGKGRIEWADLQMPVLREIRDRFERERPLQGHRIAACLHVTTETANLMRTLAAGGARVALCASNPLSTQDDNAASLVRDYGISTFAIRGEDSRTYYRHIHRALDLKPTMTLDDGADLVTAVHQKRTELIPGLIASMEETTTGVIRLRAMARDGALKIPVVSVNDAQTKFMFDNRYGTGQSTVDGIIRATNILMAGRTMVVAGYGWCGRGVANRARGLGAKVVVTEVEPIRALEAAMDGFQVMPLKAAARLGDIFITVTGDKNVIDMAHLQLLKSGAILANSGHFNVEINIPALESMSRGKRRIRSFVDEFTLKDGRLIYLLGEGRLINLAAAEGHPASVMDMSFADQALCLEYMVKNHTKLKREVYSVPESIDAQVATLKLRSMNIRIDRLTAAQKKYLTSWQEGT